jgi:hypothetical protein
MANINNGTVTVQVVGGVGPYQYTLLNAGTNQPIPNNAYPTFQNPVNNIVSNTFTFGNATDNTGNSGLAPGQYKVKIVDSNLCETISNTLFVTDITPIPPTATPVPVPTATILPTATAIIPTATPVPDPTATEVIPTATPEPEPTATEVIPTATPEPEPTATEVIPTATPEPDPTATAIPDPTATPVPDPTATEVIPTATPVPDPTATAIPAPTATPISFDELNVISGVQVEPGSIWEQFSGQYNFTNDPTSQANVDALTCYFTGLILTDPTKFAYGNTNYIISGETLQIGTQIYTGGAPYPGILKGIVHNSSLPTYNQNFVHSINYTYIETDANGIINYIITDTICAPAPTATPVPDPTATEVIPTATPVPDPTATEVIPTATPVPAPTATAIPVPTATPVPDPTATAIPVPTATPVPAPTATPVPAPTSTPVPEPTATSVPEGSPTYWFHWNGNGGYPGVDSLTTPSSAYYLNDNTTTTDFDLIFVDMLANEGTPNNLEQYDAAVFSAINNTIIPNGTLVFAANVASSERYYIAIPKSISTTDYVTTAKFADAANGIPFTFASKLDFTHLGNAYTLYEVFDQPIAGALTLNVV